MKFGRMGKKAAKGYIGLKSFKGLTKLAALCAAGWGAFRVYQNRKHA